MGRVSEKSRWDQFPNPRPRAMCLGEPDVTRMESRSHLQRFMRNTTRREMTLKEQTSAIHLEEKTPVGNQRSKSNREGVCVTETRGLTNTL